MLPLRFFRLKRVHFRRGVDALHGVLSDDSVNVRLAWLGNRIHHRVHNFQIVRVVQLRRVSFRGRGLGDLWLGDLRLRGRRGRYIGNHLGSWLLGNHLCGGLLWGDLQGRLGSFVSNRLGGFRRGLRSVVVAFHGVVVVRVLHRGTCEITQPVVVVLRRLRGVVVVIIRRRSGLVVLDGGMSDDLLFGRHEIRPPRFGRGGILQLRIHQLRRVSRDAVGSVNNLRLVHGVASPLTLRRDDDGRGTMCRHPSN